MAWTDPSGHVWATGEIVTAASMNTFIKDNLIDLDRRTSITGANVDTSETTTSTSYADLATSGPAVTVTIGSTGLALVALYCRAGNTTAATGNWMAFAVSGATTVAASDPFGLDIPSPNAGNTASNGATFRVSGLTAGSNTFTAKYKTTAGTATFQNRKILVTPLGS